MPRKHPPSSPAPEAKARRAVPKRQRGGNSVPEPETKKRAVPVVPTTGKRKNKVRGLTPHQLAFVDAWFACGMNGAEAVRQSGVSSSKTPNIIANQYMRKPAVAAEIARRQVQAQERAELTLDDVIAELRKIAFVNLADVMVIDPETGKFAPDTAKLVAMSDEERRNFMASVGEIRVDRATGLITKIKHLDKKGALVDLGKHLGMKTGVQEITGKDGGPLQHQVLQGVVKLPTDPVEASRAYQELVRGAK